MFSLVMQTPPENVLYGYGPLGVGVVALAVALYKLFNVIMNDRDKAIEQRDALLNDFFTKILPAFTENTKVLESRQSLDRDIIQVMRDCDNALKENTRALQEFGYSLRAGRNSPPGGT